MPNKNYQTIVRDKKRTARALISNSPISVKYATEICNQIKTKPVNKVIKWLEKIIAHEDYLPLKRYHLKVGHRKGEAKSGEKAGRYPKKTATEFIKLLKLAKSNADFKGLDAEKLLIVHAFAVMGINRYSYQPKGRISGKVRRRNATNIEVIVQEMK